MTTSLLKKSSDEKQMYFFGLGMIEIMQQTHIFLARRDAETIIILPPLQVNC